MLPGANSARYVVTAGLAGSFATRGSVRIVVTAASYRSSSAWSTDSKGTGVVVGTSDVGVVVGESDVAGTDGPVVVVDEAAVSGTDDAGGWTVAGELVEVVATSAAGTPEGSVAPFPEQATSASIAAALATRRWLIRPSLL
ncbi:MAG TPA: hypothetical protein PLV68_01745 [Ilumatobacteraceae bacterium]|nr:hypothetical protein [Ilumatobacteraceae bacterium]